VRMISPTVCTGANSQKPALGPTHPFESYHTSELAHEEAGMNHTDALDSPTPS
jgi:hypothetical protein